MVQVKRFQSGDTVTRELLDSHAQAIQELQRLAITSVQPPLSLIFGTLLVGQSTEPQTPLLVNVSTVSGSSGTLTTPCSYVYGSVSAYDGGTTFSGTFAPLMERSNPENGAKKPATYGWLQRQSSGTMVLVSVNEHDDTGPCTPPA